MPGNFFQEMEKETLRRIQSLPKPSSFPVTIGPGYTETPEGFIFREEEEPEEPEEEEE